MADMINLDSSGNNYFFKSNGDGTFDAAVSAGGPAGSITPLLADIDGDGRPDIMKYSSSGNSISYSYADGEDAGDNIESITNTLRGITHITYGNSSEFPLHLIPFIVHPVTLIDVDDNINTSPSETSYTYMLPYYDYDERDFRGFAFISQTNPDNSVINKSYEINDDYKKGRLLSIDIREYEGSGSPHKLTGFTWETYSVPNTSAKFVKLIAKSTFIVDSTSEHIEEQYTYDNTHGGVLTTVKSGSGAENVTITDAYINKGAWIWRKASESITGSSTGLARQTNYTYYSNGNLETKTYQNTSGADPVEEYTYDSYGNIHTYEDPKDNITEYTYDSTFTYITNIAYPITDGVDHEVDMVYNLFGKLGQETDENGKRTSYDYDAFGRLEQIQYPDYGKTIYERYDSADPVYVKTSVLEEDTPNDVYVDTYEYFDGYGRSIMNVSGSINGKYSIIRKHYDGMGRNWKFEGPYFVTTYAFSHTPPLLYPSVEKEFDWLGREVIVKTPHYQGSQSSYDTTSYAYDGFETTITDAKGNTRTEVRDYLGRIIEVQEDTEGSTATYAYNAAGDLTLARNPFIIQITYNTLGQKIEMNDPDMGEWSYSYDLNGNLETQTDAKNQTITFSYDELNRLQQKSYSTSDPTVYYYYDNLSVANGSGRLDYVTNTNVTTTYNGYDAIGRVLSLTKNISGDQARTTSYIYDL